MEKKTKHKKTVRIELCTEVLAVFLKLSLSFLILIFKINFNLNFENVLHSVAHFYSY